jgi:hypothetical protein
MVIPEEREGKSVDDQNLARDTTPANATVNTRQGGGTVSTDPLQSKVSSMAMTGLDRSTHVNAHAFGVRLPHSGTRPKLKFTKIVLK